MTTPILLLIAFAAGVFTMLACLYLADRRIRHRHGLHTEDQVSAALLAYESPIWLDYEREDAARTGGAA